MCAPRYQDIPPEEIPEVVLEDGIKIRVIAGNSSGTEGAIKNIVTAPMYLDVTIPENTEFVHPIPENHSAFVYTFQGDGHFGVTETNDGQILKAGQLGVLSGGDTVRVLTQETSVRFLLLAAQSIKEPIAKYGPFVMNTNQEIQQAIHDYQSGNFIR